jgi:DNA (cytosine-5)-methyltransferase 1
VNFYNENDPKAAAWLRELIKAGHIAAGVVDERSIRDVRPGDLTGFCQCHFFAGIGGWSYALRLAGWPDDEPVWTGSCPCQPFSSAGKAQGLCDERHLWPAFRGLIAECHPAIVFGEQVASKDGRAWLAGVRSDLEGDGYAVGAADLCAACVGAPHIRQRLYWVGIADRAGRNAWKQTIPILGYGSPIESASSIVRLAYTDRTGHQGQNRGGESGETEGTGTRPEHPCGIGATGCMADASTSRCDRTLKGPEGDSRNETRLRLSGAHSGLGGLDHPDSAGCAQLRRPGANSEASAAAERDGGDAAQPPNGGHVIRADWSRFELIPCRDGKSRRIESGTFPLAHGVPGRVGLLRGYGNAIVAPLAEKFIRASVEAIT